MTIAVGLSALAALFWVVSGILASKVTEKVDAVFLSFVSLMPAAAVLLVGTLVIGQGSSFGTISWERLLFLGLAGLSNYVLARTFFYISIRKVGVGRTVPVANISVLAAPLMAVGLLGEAMTVRVALGLASVFAGMYLITRGRP